MAVPIGTCAIATDRQTEPAPQHGKYTVLVHGDRFLLANRSSGPAGRELRATAYMDEGDSGPSAGLMALDQLPVSQFRGKQEVLALSSRLRELALRCGQRGLVDHLEYQLSVPYFGNKLPCVLLFHAGEGISPAAMDQAEHSSGDVEGHALVAAVLLHEYRLAGVRSGAYIPADSAGDWTILAPHGAREKIAQQAAAYLLRQGATLVLLSSVARPGEEPQPGREVTMPQDAGRIPVASSQRSTLRKLPLGSTLDETLGRMGSHTRRNLRLARRRAVVQLGTTFVADSLITEGEFLAMNHEGFYPVPDPVARWRYRSVQRTPGGFLAGVQTCDGVWIALLGGRRFQGPDGAYTAVDWQLNRTGFAPYSPGSLIRSFLMEHEIARGTCHLRFEGGTPHSMRSAFEPEVLREWLYARPRWTAASLRRLGQVLPKGNLLGDFLNSANVQWREDKPSV